MKRFAYWMVGAMLFLTVIHARTIERFLYFTNTRQESHVENLEFYRDFVVSEIKRNKEIEARRLEENFYKQRIPGEYADAFLYHTRNFPHLRMNFYSIMVHESGNFNKFVNYNDDGSIDFGPSQLNSRNIESDLFMDLFAPEDRQFITNSYCMYMVVTINYYSFLVEKYGEENAFYGYNGGERAAIAVMYNRPELEELINRVVLYDKRVRDIIDRESVTLKAFQRAHSDKRGVIEKNLDRYLEAIKTRSDAKAGPRSNIVEKHRYAGIMRLFIKRKHLYEVC